MLPKLDLLDYISRHKTALFLTLIYAALISFISAHHEVWRDEVRALSIVTDNPSLVQMFHALKNEGHPYLWYLILYIATKIIHASVALKIAHILMASIAICIFLSKAPFDWFCKILFAMGYFPLYQYAVINRHYGATMLFLFLFCIFYRYRFTKSIALGSSLFFLANTSMNGLMITIVVSLLWILEFLGKPAEERKLLNKLFFYGWVIAILGTTLSLICIWPDRTVSATNIYHLNWDQIFQFVAAAVRNTVSFPQTTFGALGLSNAFLTALFVWIFSLYLIRKPLIFMFFLFNAIALNLFFSMVYPGNINHYGFLYLLVIASLWMDADTGLKKGLFSGLSYGLFTVLVVCQVFMSYFWVNRDLKHEYSSSKRAGEYIRAHQELRHAIIISEQDYLAESLPYYIDNPIYIPREKRFGRATLFTEANAQNYSLGKLLGDAKKLRATYHRPVLIMIGYPLSLEGPFEIPIFYNRVFSYSKHSLALFMKNTKKIAGFHQALTNENYDMYILL